LAAGRRLNYRVLLSVQSAAEFVTLAGWDAHFLAKTTAIFVTVRDALGSAIVSGRNDLLILYDDRANLTAQTSAPLARKFSNRNKVLIPTRSLHGNNLLFLLKQ
jgi:hypothetical protein